MNRYFNSLDESKGGLRLLYILWGNLEFTQSELRSQVKKLGVGGTAFKTSLDRLHQFGLVVTRTEIRNGTQVKLTSLTEHGNTIAVSVSKLYSDLQKYVILEHKK